MMPRILGISGAAGAGKDTVAEYVMGRYGAHRISFARPMKEAVEVMFDVGPEIWDRDVKEVPQERLLGFSPRHLVQTLGTEWGRALDKNFWVRLALMKAKEYLERGGPVVISDVRFENEASMIHYMGGAVIGVMRPSLEEKSVRAHISEAGINEALIDAVILNDGPLNALPGKVEDALEEIEETRSQA